jgi:hypothetical protein
MSSVAYLPIFQPNIRRSTLPVDITSDYPFYRLFSLLSLAVLQSTICPAPLGLSILQPTFLCTLLYSALSAITTTTVRSTPRQRRHHFGASQNDYPLSSVLRCYNRLSAVLLCPSLIVNALKLPVLY